MMRLNDTDLLLFDIKVYQYILSQYSEKAPTGAKVPTGTSLNIEKTMYKTSTSMSKLLKSITYPTCAMSV